MKTLAQILVVASLASFVACGPSAEQKAEQARQDSIRISDSMAMVQQAEEARQDSINAAMAAEADTTMMEVPAE